MCGIAGFFNPYDSFTSQTPLYQNTLDQMNLVQRHRGPDDTGTFLKSHCGLAHVRLSILDQKGGHQPMTRFDELRHCTIVHNGEIYNMNQLKYDLKKNGISFSTTSDTEVLLRAYMYYGMDFVQKLNGIFAFAIYDEAQERLLLYRDHLGVKPLFYTLFQNTLIFSSELKGLFCYPGFDPVIDDNSLREVFALGPAKTYGYGVFQNTLELLPGHFLLYDKTGLSDHTYWKLLSQEHTESFDATVEHTRYLLRDSIQLQLLSDVPVCTFLSGGIDSSIVTSISALTLSQEEKKLASYSFDFIGNDKYFQANDFQPSQDRPFVDEMVAFSNTDHHYLFCDKKQQIDLLFQCVDARDLPCMADVESSMMFFCSKVAEHHKVALTGECSDEIFGGYPWFHRQECFDADLFPWSMDMTPRECLLKDDVAETLDLTGYARNAYHATISETPRLESDNAVERRRREISYLNIRWFMTTLLDRMDRTSMHCGLEARVPLADYRILSYVWNVPWNYKTKNGLVKGLLRHACREFLPHSICFRPKSPYPKTYDPDYEKLLSLELLEIITDSAAPITRYLDVRKVEQWLAAPADYGKPFYGQLMARPQQIAFLLQTNYWLQKYH